MREKTLCSDVAKHIYNTNTTPGIARIMSIVFLSKEKHYPLVGVKAVSRYSIADIFGAIILA